MDTLGYYIYPLIGEFVLYGVISALAMAPGNYLKDKFSRLGELKGKQKATIIASIGQPNSVTALANGKTLCQWMATGYHISLLFDGEVCQGVTQEFSIGNEAQYNQIQQDYSYRKCPFCAENIKHEAVICRFCGKTVPAIDNVLNNIPPETIHKLSFDYNQCINCPLCNCKIRPEYNELMNKKFVCPECKKTIKFDADIIPPKSNIIENIEEYIIHNVSYKFKVSTIAKLNRAMPAGFNVARETSACKSCGEQIALLSKQCPSCKSQRNNAEIETRVSERTDKYLTWLDRKNNKDLQQQKTV